MYLSERTCHMDTCILCSGVFTNVVERFLSNAIKTQGDFSGNVSQITGACKNGFYSKLALKLPAQRTETRCQSRNLQHRRMQLMRKSADDTSKLHGFVHHSVELRHNALWQFRTGDDLADKESNLPDSGSKIVM